MEEKKINFSHLEWSQKEIHRRNTDDYSMYRIVSKAGGGKDILMARLEHFQSGVASLRMI